MKNRIWIIAATVAFMASSCVLPSYVKPPAAPQPDGQSYYYPDFTAEVSEQSEGTFVASVSADQRSEELSTMIVTLNGETKCNEGTKALVGTCAFTIDGPTFVQVTVNWREAVETLWTGWVE